jgi:hypothetical protein
VILKFKCRKTILLGRLPDCAGAQLRCSLMVPENNQSCARSLRVCFRSGDSPRICCLLRNHQHTSQGWKLSLQLTDQCRDANAVRKHGERVSLGDALFAMNEGDSHIVASDHKCSPVFVTIKYKPGSHRPLVSNSPQHISTH